MSDANKAIITRWFEEVWNLGREETIDELMTKDAFAYNGGGPGVHTRGPAEFKAFYWPMRSAFPDLHVRIDHALAEGDLVVVQYTVTGTHTGQGLWFAPTGKSVEITGMTMVRIDNGKMVEGWNNWDAFSMLQQLGEVQAPPRAFVSPAAKESEVLAS